MQSFTNNSRGVGPTETTLCLRASAALKFCDLQNTTHLTFTECTDFTVIYWLLEHAIRWLLLRAGIPQKKWSGHHGRQKSQKCSTWMQSQKWQNDLSSFQGKPFNITVIQVYALTSNAEEAEVEHFYEDLQDLLELTPKKDVLFIIWDWNAKVGS